MYVGDESVNAGVDTGRIRSVYISAARNEIVEDAEVGQTACIGGVRLVSADALEIVALKIELSRLRQSLFGDARVLAHERRTKRRPVTLVLPARIRHHPVEIIEQTGNKEVHVALARAQRRIDLQPVFADQMGDDGLAVADGLAVVDDIGKLPARRSRRVEKVLMYERQSDESQERKDLQPVTVVVGHAKERRIGIESDHGGQPSRQGDMYVRGAQSFALATAIAILPPHAIARVRRRRPPDHREKRASARGNRGFRCASRTRSRASCESRPRYRRWRSRRG